MVNDVQRSQGLSPLSMGCSKLIIMQAKANSATCIQADKWGQKQGIREVVNVHMSPSTRAVSSRDLFTHGSIISQKARVGKAASISEERDCPWPKSPWQQQLI